MVVNLRQRQRKAVRAKGASGIPARKRSVTGIPACASAATQTGLSEPQQERQIDARIYRLYGLTPEEIKIVEEGTAR